MAYDRGYRREPGRHRRREPDYGWGVPIRGMYDPAGPRRGYGGEYDADGFGGRGARGDRRKPDRGGRAGTPDGYAGYRFRDGSGGEARGWGAEAGYDPARERPFYRSRGPRGRRGRFGGRVAPGGD